MGAKFLDEAARAAFEHAIHAVEDASAVEVVVAFRHKSASYRHVNVALGACVAFVALATMLFVDRVFSLTSILVDPFVAGIATGGLVELVPPLKRVATRAAARRRHVERAARATFVERGIHNTTGRTGLLVYIAWLERQVALIADTQLARAWPPEARAAAEAELTTAMRDGGAAVARALAALGPSLTRARPHQLGDVNELPDAIDEDRAP